MTLEELAQTIMHFMDHHTTMTLACCDSDGPWAAPVYYARQGFDLIFFSSPTSRHCSTFARNPKAAAAIYGEYERWQDIKGLQMEGFVEPLTSAVDKARATTTYLLRFPFAREFLISPKIISAHVATKMSQVTLHQFRPRIIRYLNNEDGFGNRWKLNIFDGEPVGAPIRG